MVKIGHRHLISGMAWVPDLEALGQDLSRTKGWEDPGAAEVRQKAKICCI